jgi:hypothetical protein
MKVSIITACYNSARTIGWGWMAAHPAFFISRRLYRQYGVFKTDYAIAAEFEFVARLFAKPDFSLCPPPLHARLDMQRMLWDFRMAWSLQREPVSGLRGAREDALFYSGLAW